MRSATQEKLSDTDLLRRHINGEGEAFAALVRRYEKELYSYLARFTGDAALADDVFQETFLQVHQSAALFDHDKPFRPWLYAVATNKARDALRKRGRHPTAPLDAVVPSDAAQNTTYAELMPSNIPAPEEDLLNLETRQAVQTMVEQIPDGLRDVLILSYFQELPHKDISEALSIPIGTVKSRLYNALRLFAEKWKVYAHHNADVRASEESSPEGGKSA